MRDARVEEAVEALDESVDFDLQLIRPLDGAVNGCVQRRRVASGGENTDTLHRLHPEGVWSLYLQVRCRCGLPARDRWLYCRRCGVQSSVRTGQNLVDGVDGDHGFHHGDTECTETHGGCRATGMLVAPRFARWHSERSTDHKHTLDPHGACDPSTSRYLTPALGSLRPACDQLGICRVTAQVLDWSRPVCWSTPLDRLRASPSQLGSVPPW